MGTPPCSKRGALPKPLNGIRTSLAASGPILAAATEGHRVRLALFALGKASSLEVTEAETTLRRARLAAVVARVEVRIAELKVLHAVGFGLAGRG